MQRRNGTRGNSGWLFTSRERLDLRDLPPAELVESLHGPTDLVVFHHSPLCERDEGVGDSPNTRTTSRSPGRRFWDTGPCLEDAANSEARAPARQQNGYSTGSAAFKRANSWERLSALNRSPSEDGGGGDGLSWHMTPRMWAAVGRCTEQRPPLLRVNLADIWHELLYFYV